MGHLFKKLICKFKGHAYAAPYDDLEPTPDNNDLERINNYTNLAITEPSNFDSSHPDLARIFLGWLQQNLRTGKLKINRRNAMVHIVAEGILLLSPKIFKAFTNDYDALHGDDFAVKRTQNKLEKMMRKTGLHKKTASGMNIHTYLVQGPRYRTKINGWLLPLSVVYQTPDINCALINTTGFWKPVKKKANRRKHGVTNATNIIQPKYPDVIANNEEMKKIANKILIGYTPEDQRLALNYLSERIRIGEKDKTKKISNSLVYLQWLLESLRTRSA